MTHDLDEPGARARQAYDKASHFNAAGRHDLAERQLLNALGDDPEDVSLLIELTRTQMLTDRLDEAEQTCRQVLALAPQLDGAHQLHGFVLMQAGRHAEAERSLLTALRLNADSGDNIWAYGLLMHRTGHVDKAEQLFRKALALDPDDERYHDSLALVLSERHKADEADHHVRRSLALDPDDEGAHVTLGVAMLRRGRPFAARRALREALRLDPSDEQTRELWLTADRACRWIYLPMYYWALAIERIPGQQFTVWAVFVAYVFGLEELGIDPPFEAVIVYGYLALVLYTWVADLLVSVWLRVVPPK